MIKLFKNLKPYTLSIIVVMVFVFLQSFSEIYLPTLMADIVDTGGINWDIAYIIRIGGWMLLIAVIGMISAIFGSYWAAKVATGFGRDLRTKVFTKVESFSLEEFDEKGTASLITRTTNDITQIQQLVVMLRLFLRAPMLCIGSIIMAVSKNAKLSLVLVVILLILTLLIVLLSKKSMPLFKSMQIKLDHLNLVLRENLTGIRVIRAFNRDNYEKKRFNEANLDLTETAIKVNKLMAILMPLVMLIFNLTIIAILWFGSIRINSGSMQVGDLMAFIQYASQIMFSLIILAMMFILIPRASASAIRINEVLDIEPKIKDPMIPEESELKMEEGARSEEGKRGYLEFDEVSFYYQGAEEPAIEKISFSARPGEITAIIGGTGSGKSTLVNLIPRFYEVTSGRILVDGVDIRELTQEKLRAKIGLVPQKAVLFTGTVAENISFGTNDLSGDKIIRAAKIAQASEFISTLEQGYDSQIAQGGTNVSGGQKQQLSIARALAKHPEIYIFDDSFSALDFKTDAKLRQALKKETKKDTVLIIAQRVTTVMDADRIMVLDGGKIVGMGTHQDLIKTCEVYREIVASQLSEEEWS
ncbi:MAG: multidrug ABC transporter ATP-binding protein [Candidatus Infernicultor aquiphilus]|nr:MAG: multidrug ABC transporter ATP-binding protein [Candidatus Atribacteria bacterium CG17_big_fil_post_rev_8_21_14_2_50_34_11]